MVFNTISLLDKLTDSYRCLSISSGSISACSRLISGALREKNRQVLWIVSEKALAENRMLELSFFSGNPARVLPSYEHFGFLPLVPAAETGSKRIEILHDLMEGTKEIVVGGPSVLIDRFIPGDEIRKHAELVMEEEELDREAFLKWLVETGYERMPKVLHPGHFSVRGEVIDIFSPGFGWPIRLVLFDEIVEEIRLFDIETQRTAGRRKEVVLLPAAESILSDILVERARNKIVSGAAKSDWSGAQVAQVLHSLESRRQAEGSLALMPFLYDRLWSVFDFLAQDALIVLESPLAIATSIVETLQRMDDSYLSQVNKGRLLPVIESFRQDMREISDGLQGVMRIFLNPPPVISHTSEPVSMFLGKCGEVVEIDSRTLEPSLFTSVADSRAELFGPFFHKINEWLKEGRNTWVSSDSDSGIQRLSGLIEHYGQDFQVTDTSFSTPDENHHGGLFLAKGYVEEAFLLNDTNEIFIPDHCLFRVSAGPGKGKKPKNKETTPLSLSEMVPGDLSVHRDKGIGRYLGLVRMNAAGLESEFVLLEYRGGDKLYVPVDRLGLLQKYVGLEGREPRLDRLGGRSWIARKTKVKKAIKEVAHELVELYALRKVKEGLSFRGPDEMYRQFEAAFPYEETMDQVEAIRDITEDLSADYPMDRLLCGDVGFGKTEVAMRAAFLAVENGYQVAVLVPTTLLAEQHERTFMERFRDFPVTIAGLSRMKSRAEQRNIISRVRSGKIDILIGTHRLLQSDIIFRRLGLIIIDEEHRFGVKHKEKLKLLARDINCLSLTATPIPRTLQLSLLGIRDLSTIEIPPRGRVAVKTFLAEYDDSIVRDAIYREIDRGGQVFFVHNRVKGIYRVTEHIASLVQKARIDVAHGQMDPAELEEKMIRFVRGEIDCLVCTTIIESGLDIPAANTLIINRADRLGIADLYQLRGRVGRSNLQAFAYLFVPSLEFMTRDASLRLKAIMETSELGAGMNLAMHDLKIRGAGNLLGVAQAGQISEVGYDLYLELLKEAIEDIKGNKITERPEPEVNLSVAAFVPEEYAPDIGQRLELYRRFSEIESEADRVKTMKELEDRFGYVPEEVCNLLDIMVIKALLRKLNCVRLDGATKESPRLTLSFGAEGPTNSDGFIRLIQGDGKLKLLPGERVLFRMNPKGVEANGFLKETILVLKELIKLTK